MSETDKRPEEACFRMRPNRDELPFAIDRRVVAKVTGFEVRDIDILMYEKYLIPLGDASRNQRKLFCTSEVFKLQEHRALSQARKIIMAWHQRRNRRKTSRFSKIGRSENRSERNNL